MKLIFEPKINEIMSDFNDILKSDNKTKNSSFLSDTTYQNFKELTALIMYNTELSRDNYINELLLQKMRNIFHYLFESVPNCLLLQIKPLIEINRSLKLNIGERIIGKSSGFSSDDEVVYLSNIYDSQILPIKNLDAYYDYNESCIKIRLSNNKQFILDTEIIDFWINYNHDVISSIMIYNILKQTPSCKIKFIYTSDNVAEHSALLNFEPTYSIHPNSKTKMMFSSPEMFLVMQLKINDFLKSAEQIKYIEATIPCSPFIDKYKIKNIFHINYFPFLNTYSDYAELIEFSPIKEEYPLISPMSDKYVPCFIKNVEYTNSGKIIKLDSEICNTTRNLNTYKISYNSPFISKKYNSIHLNLPENILSSEIRVLADWVNLSELEIEKLNFSFFKKQQGAFSINTISYKSFSDIETSNNIAKLMKLLKIQNLHTYTKEDFIFIFKLLIPLNSSFIHQIYNLNQLSLNYRDDNIFEYILDFKKTNNINHTLINYMVSILQIFLNYNFGIEKKIICKTKFTIRN